MYPILLYFVLCQDADCQSKQVGILNDFPRSEISQCWDQRDTMKATMRQRYAYPTGFECMTDSQFEIQGIKVSR